jgi:hypothetical protein
MTQELFGAALPGEGQGEVAAVSARQGERGGDGRLQVLVDDADAGTVHHVERAGHRKRRDRYAGGMF